jgi:hypothetical protein
MTKTHGIFGFIVILLTIIFTLGGCDNGTTSSAGLDDFPDTFTHATPTNKIHLTGDQLERAYNFLEDGSHYFYITRAIWGFDPNIGFVEPGTGGPNAQTAKYGFDTEWRSPVNGRVYRGPYTDPLNRSVLWLTINPNGSINASIGSYWAFIRPGQELTATTEGIDIAEAYGYVKSTKPQIVSYNALGQNVNNMIERKRATFAIDANLSSEYGITESIAHFFVDVKLNHAKNREVTPQQYYDGLLPWTSNMVAQMAFMAYDTESEDFTYIQVPDFWKLTKSEQDAYIAKLNADPRVTEQILKNTVSYNWFDIMDVTAVTASADINIQYEWADGKVNAVDVNDDGFLDTDAQGNVIVGGGQPLSNFGYVYDLNYNEGWWYKGFAQGQPYYIDGNGDLVPLPETGGPAKYYRPQQ